MAEIFGTDKSFNLLLRPDNYIGFISQEISAGELRTYLNEFVRDSPRVSAAGQPSVIITEYDNS